MSESWKIVGNLCRCCHSEGSPLPSLSVSGSKWKGLVYSNMMKICFDINLPLVEGTLGPITYTICKQCIMKLEDATLFKKQVLKCEERFMNVYNRNIIVADFESVEVKQEEEDFSTEENADEIEDDLVNGVDEQDCPDVAGESEDNWLSSDDYEDQTDLGSFEDLELKKENQVSNVEDCKENSDEIEDRLGGDDIEEAGNELGGKKFHMQPTDYQIIDKDYICLHCGKKYTKKVSLRYHVKAKHYRVPLFRCYVCGKEFMTMAPLSVHKLEEHAIDERFKCNACSSSFNTSVQLRKHKNNFHMLGERHRCEFCDYESFSFQSLYKHKFKHKTVKDFMCRFCKKPFLRKATLNLHERIHTGDRRKVCKVCGQAFVQKASLNYHMTKYHPEVKP